MVAMMQCPKCKRVLDFADATSGTAARCATCGEPISDAEANIAVRPEAPAALGRTEVKVEQVTIKLSLHDTMGRSRQDVPPPPRPLRLVPVAPRGEEPADGPRQATACPRCKARVFREDESCHACGEILSDPRPSWEWREPFPPLRMDYEPGRGGLIIALGILGVCLGPLGLPFAIAAWVMGQNDLQRIDQKALDPAGYLNTRDGMVCGRIGTALSIVMILFVAWIMTRF